MTMNSEEAKKRSVRGGKITFFRELRNLIREIDEKIYDSSERGTYSIVVSHYDIYFGAYPAIKKHYERLGYKILERSCSIKIG